MLGIKPQLLFGLDESELGALLDNPQLMSQLHLNDFRPPDDDSTPLPVDIDFHRSSIRI